MARKRSEFKNDGIVAGTSYVTKRNTDISSSTELIAAPSVASQSIVITDISFGAGSGHTLTLYEGSTILHELWSISSGHESLNFTGPLKLTAGEAFNIMLDSTDVDWSILVTYYIEG